MVATDSSEYETRQTSIRIEIHINDVNDNAPVFEEYPFKAQVPVSTPPGQNILRVKANDMDFGVNKEITYSLLREHEKPKFRIHPSTGIVSVTSSLAQESQQIYYLEVLATDKGSPPLSTRGLIEFHISDLSDFAPVLKFQNDSYNVLLKENSAAGTYITQVTAVRSDGRKQRIIYSIGSGNELNIFRIDDQTGSITINDPSKLDADIYNNRDPEIEFSENTDADHQEEHWIDMHNQQTNGRVTVNSNLILTLIARTIGPDPLEAYVKLVIRISDINDNAPIFTQSQYSATVLEGNTKGDLVLKVSLSKFFYTENEY